MTLPSKDFYTNFNHLNEGRYFYIYGSDTNSNFNKAITHFSKVIRLYPE